MLKEKFKFKLCKDFLSEYGEEHDYEYLAILKGGVYFVSWEEGQKEEDCPEYMIQEVLDFISDGDWILISE